MPDHEGEAGRGFRTVAWNRLRYTLYAPLYDQFVGRLGPFRRGRRRAFEMAALRPGERLLIVAAGTGLDLPLVPAGVEVVATDVTPAMLRRLEDRARALGRPVSTAVMDAAALGLPDRSVDCVALHLALAVVPDPEAAIREAARVLRPGGRVSVFDKFLPPGTRPSPLRRVVSAVADVVASDLNRSLEPLLASAGLALVSYEPVGLGGNFVAARAERVGASAAAG